MDCDLRIELGEAQRQAGLAAFRETFLQAAAEARDLGATDRLVRAALSNNRGFVSMIGSIDADRVAVLEAALDALPAGDSRERALVLATLCSEITYGSSLEQRRTIADEARAMADRLSDPVTSIRVLNLVFSPLQVPSLQAEQTADVKKALFLAELLGDPDLQYGPAYHARYNAIHAADFESAARHLATMRSLSDLLRQPTLMWTTAVSEATEALLVGEPDRAEQLAAAALQMGTDSGQPDAATWYGGQVGVVLAQRGRQAELVPLFEQLVDENPGVGSFNQGLAMAYLDAGEDGRALALLEAAAADEFASFPQDLVWIFGITAYADVAVHLRATGPARILFELLAPFHDRVPIIAPAAVPPVVVLPRRSGHSAWTLRRRRGILPRGHGCQHARPDEVLHGAHGNSVGPDDVRPQRPRRPRPGARALRTGCRGGGDSRLRGGGAAGCHRAVDVDLTPEPDAEKPRDGRRLRLPDLDLLLAA